MPQDFMEAMEDTMNVSVTENGAVGYRTTGKALLDLNFAVASLRSASCSEITLRFYRAFVEDRVAAMRWLFYARDVRGGLGERRLFRTIMVYMEREYPEYLAPVLELIPQYGRYDDLLCLLGTKLEKNVMEIISRQLKEDMEACESGADHSISLLAKWMPSVNASSPETIWSAKRLCRNLHMTEAEYRKTLSGLRARLDVVERKMSAGQWGDIRYKTVPSRANLIYNNAFLRNDEDRRRKYLDQLANGETKIHSGTLFPHEIVNKYRSSSVTDNTLEALWSALPDTVQGCGNTICVCDTSGSMIWVTLPGSTARPLEVAEAMSIYFAERSSGAFRDKFLTFSDHPQLIDLRKGESLRGKLDIIRGCFVGGSTNIEAVFDLILRTALEHKMSQDDLPQNVLIISDMEFNAAIFGYSINCTLFDTIRDTYEKNGYKLPRLIFWNVASRTGTIPIKENALGVALVSGFSPNIAKMIMSGKTDPYECLLETLNSARYDAVEAALKNV